MKFLRIPKNCELVSLGLWQIESQRISSHNCYQIYQFPTRPAVDRTGPGWLCSVLQAQLADNGGLCNPFHGVDPTHPK